VPVGNQYYLTTNNTDGHYQDNRAEIFLANTSALQAAGIQAVLFGAGNAGQTTYTDAKADGITNNGGVPTTDLLGGCNACNTHVSSYADDDGGFLRIFVGRFYASRQRLLNRLPPPPAPQSPPHRQLQRISPPFRERASVGPSTIGSRWAAISR
jgi:hypothetical protein